MMQYLDVFRQMQFYCLSRPKCGQGCIFYQECDTDPEGYTCYMDTAPLDDSIRKFREEVM